MFRFENKDILYLLLALPALFLLFWYNRRTLSRNIKKFGNVKLIQRLLINFSTSRPWWKFGLLSLGLLMLIFALARPQFGSKLKEVKKEGMEIVIAMDVSRSMEAKDIAPNRLASAKRSIEHFVNKLDGDMLGMIVFAGDAYIQIPLTNDYGAARMYLDNVDTDIAPVQGTNLSKAINMSVKAFSPDPEPAKVLLIISDGEDHEENAVEAAKMAAKDGVKIYTVGMGTKKGGPIPKSSGGFHKNNAGEVVISKLNEQVLSSIAKAGNGKYVLAGKSGSGLDVILNDISTLDKTERKVEVYAEFDDQYQYPLALAIVLLLIEVIISRKKEHTIEKLKSLKS
ncbi:MAG: VWA domain-containing protein [Bacteroidota bacterium]|nr:VWA domain-containing protein [Bacteroidota bacterium]